MAELTRPARELKEKIRAKNRKPQGRKRIHEPRPAKYHNWLTPFCWTDIVIVAKQVGWRMSSSEIANGLKKRNPDTFGKINRNFCHQAFEGCVVRQWNLSYGCLTSFEARDALRNLKTTDAEFWKILTGDDQSDTIELPNSDEMLPEDTEPNTNLEDIDADDSDLPMSTLITSMITNDIPEGVGLRKGGALASIVDAENVDAMEPTLVEPGVVETHRVEGEGEGALHEGRGRGKRKKTANKNYSSASFWRHNDADDPNDDRMS